jgi:hypothetical protein
MGVGVWRVEAPVLSSSHPAYAKSLFSDYWSPEFEMDKAYVYPASLWAENAVAAFPTNPMEPVPRYEDYRHGFSLSGNSNPGVATGSVENFYLGLDGEDVAGTYQLRKDKYLQPANVQFGAGFTTELANDAKGAFVARTAISRMSPVVRTVTKPAIR